MVNGESIDYEYQNYNGNLALYDAEAAFLWIRRNIRSFGGDPEKITISGGSSGAGLASLLSSVETVAPYIKGVIQLRNGFRHVDNLSFIMTHFM